MRFPYSNLEQCIIERIQHQQTKHLQLITNHDINNDKTAGYDYDQYFAAAENLYHATLLFSFFDVPFSSPFSSWYLFCDGDGIK